MGAMGHRKDGYLKEIISTLVENDVDLSVCGGVALVLHGVERMTLDLDLSVDMDESNLKRFLHAMEKLGLTPRAPVPAESILDPEKRKMMMDEKNAVVFSFFDTKNAFRQVDIFIKDDLSYNSLHVHVEKMSLGDMKINIISKRKLLDMKKAIQPPR